MISPFLHNYNKSNLSADISDFVLGTTRNIKQGLLFKRYNYMNWFLIESLSLFISYNPYDEDMNLLTNDEYQNILNTIKKTLNKQYNGYN